MTSQRNDILLLTQRNRSDRDQGIQTYASSENQNVRASRSRRLKHVQFSDVYEVSPEGISTEEQDSRTSLDFLRDTFLAEPVSCWCCFRTCLDKIMCLRWFSEYEWNPFIWSDVFAGLIGATIHIPYGLAYGQLGNVCPITGIYMAIFPPVVYFLFGTSKHVSLGAYSIVCYMTGDIISNYSPASSDPIELGTAVTLIVAIVHLICHICNLKDIHDLLSKTYISAFSTGVAVHILTSQVKEILGLELDKHHGFLSIVYTIIDIVNNIKSTNIMDVIMSSSTIIVLFLNQIFLKAQIQKYLGLVPPVELIIIIVIPMTLLLANLPKIKISTVGKVRMGFPIPVTPKLTSVTFYVIVESIVVALVSYSMTIYMAFLFMKEEYEVNAHQELLAHGLSNLCGSFFFCLPVASSLSRSTTQKLAGGQSQIASLVCAVILIFSLFFLSPVTENLPRSVLGSIVIMGLWRMFRQINRLRTICTISKLDSLVWLATFLGVVFMGIIYGVFMGLVVSLVVNFIENSEPYLCLMGRIPVGEKKVSGSRPGYVYVRLRGEVGSEIPGVKIIQLFGPLNVATENHVISQIYELSGVNAKKVLKLRKLAEMSHKSKDRIEKVIEELLLAEFKSGYRRTSRESNYVRVRLKYIIIDLTFDRPQDYGSLCSLHSVMESYNKLGIETIIVCTKRSVSEFMSLSTAVEYIEHTTNINQ